MKQRLLIISLVIMLLGGNLKGWGQLFIQDFSGSNTVTDYISATPNNMQFNSISSSGSGSTISITDESLTFTRTGNACSFARTSDFNPITNVLQYKLKISVSGNTASQTSAAVFQVGSDFGTANSAETIADTYARFAINLTSTNSVWQIRDITNGQNSINLSGSQEITWVLNNSEVPIIYFSPSNQYETIGIDKADIWAGTAKLFDDVDIQTTTQTISDLKFAFTAGNASISVDDFYIDPLPVVWLNDKNSSDWNVSTNWGTGSIPNITQHVIIPSGGFQPKVNNNLPSPSSISKLSINTGSVVTVENGGALSVIGTLTNSAGASGLVIESDATGTGSLIHSTAGVAATVKRYLTNYSAAGDNKYHFLSSPVSAQPIRPDFVANTPAADVDFYKFDEPTATWINTKTEANAWNADFESNFEVGRGYLVAYPTTPQTKSFTGGTLNSYPSNTPLVITCTNTNDGGWNLIGNPFPSAIDWNLVQIDGLGDGMDAALYYYDHDAANYRYYVQLESIGSLGSGSRYIPAMQGFMVHAKTTGSKTVSLHNGHRVHHEQAFYKSQNEIDNLLTVKLHSNGNTDEAYIYFFNEATDSFDSKFDAYKLFSYAEGMPQLYTINVDEAMLAINALPAESDAKAVALGYRAAGSGIQILSFEDLTSFAQPGSLQLEDKLLGLMHPLIDGQYEFVSEAGVVNNRFILHFGAVGISEKPVSAELKAYVVGDQLYFPLQGEAMLDIFDLQGRSLEHTKVIGQGLASRAIHLPAGTYVVRLLGNQLVQTTKVFVK